MAEVNYIIYEKKLLAIKKARKNRSTILKILLLLLSGLTTPVCNTFKKKNRSAI